MSVCYDVNKILVLGVSHTWSHGPKHPSTQVVSPSLRAFVLRMRADTDVHNQIGAEQQLRSIGHRQALGQDIWACIRSKYGIRLLRVPGSSAKKIFQKMPGRGGRHTPTPIRSLPLSACSLLPRPRDGFISELEHVTPPALAGSRCLGA